MARMIASVLAIALLLFTAPATAQTPPRLEVVIAAALSVNEGEPGTPAFAEAIRLYHGLLDEAQRIDRAQLNLDDQVDHDLLIAHLRTRLFEMETIRLHEVNPASVFALGQTNQLFLRPGAIADSGVRQAVAELQRLPAALARARTILKTPARTWTENALYQAYYARLLLRDYVPRADVDSPGRPNWSPLPGPPWPRSMISNAG